MDNLLGILALAILGYLFWQQRRQSELAQQFITQRCQQLGLQVLSVARGSHRLKDDAGNWCWQTLYLFEFSADGADAYQGSATFKGLRPVQFYVPPHHMPG
ncbi:DUF3301 domain-containing protein [Photobacterium sp. TLY01]|uniref:DUF3301 domain-containing protein n=1 Tax=Photobacterium sp. TLY01 TaxID=2907534 RepID=UPI001F42AB19|nr:DUF3301 domain-containing protein [Photobacterium sp. TLY01]UIP28500.1 DUF3301 domain-containing protein [Photobacterium sp. TLY01]